MIHHFILTLIVTLFCSSLFAQSTFKKSYTAPGDEEVLAMDVGADGSVIIAGSTTGGSGGGTDGLLVKLDANGDMLWSKTFGGANPDRFWMVKSNTDGGYLAVGRVNNNLYALKTDGGGNTLWAQAFGLSGINEGFNCLEVADGYFISGLVEGFGGGRDGFVMKLDLSGSYVWGKVYLIGGSIFGEMIPDSNGSFWLSGGATGDGVLINMDASGNIISSKTVGGGFNESAYFLKASGNGFVNSDASWSFSGNSIHQPWLNSYNAQGNLVWSKVYPFPQGNSRINVEVAPGGFAFTPFFSNVNLTACFLVKTDITGNVAWAKSYPYEGTGKMRQVKSVTDGYVMAGQMNGSGSNGTDVFVIKTDLNGNITAACCPTSYAIAAQVVSPSVNTPTITTQSPALSGTTGVSATSPSPVVVDRCTVVTCCISDAGTVTESVTNICLPNTASVPHNGNQVLDNNDLLRYILFSNPNDTLGSIIVTSSTPSFTFNPATMQTGVLYYVAAIVGNNLNGNVNLNDPCLDISNAARVTWRPLPTVTFSVANPSVCAGGCTTVTATFTGTAPYNLAYTTPNGAFAQVFPNNTGAFQVCTAVGAPAGGFSVQATSLTDAWCTCQ